MDSKDLEKLQQEPACQHNKSGKGGCARAKPGATQGGCFFDGARNALLPIANAAHIVHGPISCAGTSWDNRGSRSSGADLYRKGFTTDLSDIDIIMGRGEERLYFAIQQIVEKFSPAAIFIYTTCVPALHGDDVAAVARAATARWNIPVTAVDCAGYYGSKNLGNRLSGEILLNQVIGTREPEPAEWKPNGVRKTHDIGIIGEWNVGGEFWQILPLLDELGVRVLSTLTGDSRFAEVQTLHRAEANLLVCSKAFLNVARGLQEKYGTPYTECSFYGMNNTSAALRKLAAMLDDADLTTRVQALISREENALIEHLAPYKPFLAGKRVLIFSGGFKSWSLVAAMQELGMHVVATGTEKSTEEDKERITKLMSDQVKTIDDNDQQALIRAFHELKADILIAGDRYIYPSLKSRIPFLDVDHVRHIAYTGYAGVHELARQLTRALKNPVWENVSRTAPWAVEQPEAPDLKISKVA
ncbi:nitrogenase iron-molybdenum cofactor biosynthesis protein NifE [uncultured Tolumonas sp.]|uniref:nitrogenase iron-molybdenum cofactor biosynthesis protein NifE n=1 Tax=uncultured Tolumonas sp. TaxID=263765 RepID=UPI00292FDA1C|nr:nitrogenase iron-molybdenum cofactor biosynthesis protein NifE [uncultured Tolumonas sp.]